MTARIYDHPQIQLSHFIHVKKKNRVELFQQQRSLIPRRSNSGLIKSTKKSHPGVFINVIVRLGHQELRSKIKNRKDMSYENAEGIPFIRLLLRQLIKNLPSRPPSAETRSSTRTIVWSHSVCLRGQRGSCRSKLRGRVISETTREMLPRNIDATNLLPY